MRASCAHLLTVADLRTVKLKFCDLELLRCAAGVPACHPRPLLCGGRHRSRPSYDAARTLACSSGASHIKRKMSTFATDLRYTRTLPQRKGRVASLRPTPQLQLQLHRACRCAVMRPHSRAVLVLRCGRTVAVLQCGVLRLPCSDHRALPSCAPTPTRWTVQER